MKKYLIFLSVAAIFGGSVIAEAIDVSDPTPLVTCLKDRDATIAEVRTGIASQHGKYPRALDHATNGNASKTNLLFETVLSQGVTASRWSKKGNTYTHDCPYAVTTHTYNAKTGEFH